MDIDKQQFLLLFDPQEQDNEIDLLFQHRMIYGILLGQQLGD